MPFFCMRILFSLTPCRNKEAVPLIPTSEATEMQWWMQFRWKVDRVQLSFPGCMARLSTSVPFSQGICPSLLLNRKKTNGLLQANTGPVFHWDTGRAECWAWIGISSWVLLWFSPAWENKATEKEWMGRGHSHQGTTVHRRQGWLQTGTCAAFLGMGSLGTWRGFPCQGNQPGQVQPQDVFAFPRSVRLFDETGLIYLMSERDFYYYFFITQFNWQLAGIFIVCRTCFAPAKPHILLV